ncbi:MAG: hypothetical protein WBJ21_08615 [Burkholderiaceae bacterium]
MALILIKLKNLVYKIIKKIEVVSVIFKKIFKFKLLANFYYIKNLSYYIFKKLNKKVLQIIKKYRLFFYLIKNIKETEKLLIKRVNPTYKKICNRYQELKNTWCTPLSRKIVIEKLQITIIYIFAYKIFTDIVIDHIGENTYEYIEKKAPKIFYLIPLKGINFPLSYKICWILIQAFIFRGYLNISIIIKYNILITLLMLLISYGSIYFVEALFEEEGNLIFPCSPILLRIRFKLYLIVYVWFTFYLLYCYKKAISIKEREHIIDSYKGFSRSLYFWIDYGMKVKKKRERYSIIKK